MSRFFLDFLPYFVFRENLVFVVNTPSNVYTLQSARYIHKTGKIGKIKTVDKDYANIVNKMNSLNEMLEMMMN